MQLFVAMELIYILTNGYHKPTFDNTLWWCL